MWGNWGSETPELFAQSHTARPRCHEPQSLQAFKSLVYSAALQMSRRCVRRSTSLKEQQCINAPTVPHLITLGVFPPHWGHHTSPLSSLVPFTTPSHFCSLHLQNFSKPAWWGRTAVMIKKGGFSLWKCYERKDNFILRISSFVLC